MFGRKKKEEAKKDLFEIPKEMIIPNSHQKCQFCQFLKQMAPDGCTVMMPGSREGEVIVLDIQRINLKELEKCMDEVMLDE